MKRIFPVVALAMIPTFVKADDPALAKAPGYRGIWYSHKPTEPDQESALSGGLATFSAHHIPMAYYTEKANKTFFVYGGSTGDEKPSDTTLLIMVSYFDHKTGLVPRPTIVQKRDSGDPHENPVLTLDRDGYIWAFVPGQNSTKPANIFKSVKPYEIERFQMVVETTFSFPQPWYANAQGFLLLQTRFGPAAQLYAAASQDGKTWTEPQRLAAIGTGNDHVSGQTKGKIGVAFNARAKGGTIGGSSLYYMETMDFGKTWTTAGKEKLDVPLTAPDNKALVFDYESSSQLVYLKDLNFDAAGNPTILYLTSRSVPSGSQSGSRFWITARWAVRRWQITGLIQSDDNNDTGCLHLEKHNIWRVFAPTDSGPEPFSPGGEVAMWTSDDVGRAWGKQMVTRESQYNHNGIRRPVNAHPDFYVFWADGAIRRPSESRLYFANQEGKAFMLPPEMKDDFAKPKPVEMPREPQSKNATTTQKE